MGKFKLKSRADLRRTASPLLYYNIFYNIVKTKYDRFMKIFKLHLILNHNCVIIAIRGLFDSEPAAF